MGWLVWLEWPDRMEYRFSNGGSRNRALVLEQLAILQFLLRRATGR